MTRPLLLALAILAALAVARHLRRVRAWRGDDVDWLHASCDPYTLERAA